MPKLPKMLPSSSSSGGGKGVGSEGGGGVDVGGGSSVDGGGGSSFEMSDELKKTLAQLDQTAKSDWMKFVRAVGVLGQRMQSKPRHVQNQAAHIVAALYRAFLRDGIDPHFTPISEIISRGDEPLSTLGDHVVVRESSLRGVPRPAQVTFTEGWSKIAFYHDRGYVVVVTPKMRQGLFARVTELTGMIPKQFLNGLNASGTPEYWVVPARPHIHFLKSEELNRILARLAEQIILTGKKPDLGPLMGRPTVRSEKSFRTTVGYNDKIENPAEDESGDPND